MGTAAVSGIVKDGERAEALAAVMRALGNPARLRVMACLCAGERSVGEISRTVGLSQAATSQQLSALRLHGLVRVR